MIIVCVTFLLNALVEEPALGQGHGEEDEAPEGEVVVWHLAPLRQGEHLQLPNVEVGAVRRLRVQRHHHHPPVYRPPRIYIKKFKTIICIIT